jgi:ribosomal protein S6--L-glutamate ligase
MKRVGIIASDVNEPTSNLIFNATKRYAETKLIDIHDIRIAAFKRKWEVFYPKLKLSTLDSVYFRFCLMPPTIFDFRIMLSRHLEGMGVNVINSSKSSRICRNKFSAIQVLQKHGIPTPRTRLALTPKAAMKSIRTMKKPVIIKLLSGSRGKGVMKLSSNQEAESVMDALWALNQMLYFQEYVETQGKDIRAFVVGDEVVAAMERIARPGEFRSNIDRGGKGVKIELDSKLEKLALRSTKVIGAEVAGVDIAVDGKPKVIEVNTNPGLEISRITGVDVADRIAKYIAEKKK